MRCSGRISKKICRLLIRKPIRIIVLKSCNRDAVMDFARLTGTFLNQPQNQVMVHRDVMVQEDQMVSLASLVTNAVGDYPVLPAPMVVKENAVCPDVRVMICHRK